MARVVTLDKKLAEAFNVKSISISVIKAGINLAQFKQPIKGRLYD